MSAATEREDRFTLPTYSKVPIAVTRGSGSFVWDEEGARYLDFYGGHCVTALGHCPPAVVDAVTEQLSELVFYSNAVYSPLRARAAELLVGCCPDHLVQAFFCNSGTEANEAALKMARKATGRMRIVAMDGAFHGRTLGSLAATSSSSYREPFGSLLRGVDFVPFGDIDALRRAMEMDPVAGVILEPIQSMAGMVSAEDSYYQAVERACREFGAMLIFDEVQTGVGRTGTFSISEQLGVQPDIVTLAKSLGSGIPVGAVVASRDLANTVSPGDQGSTFGGGMIAMAAMIATLETIVSHDLMKRASAVYDQIAAIAATNGLAMRGRGCLIGLDFGQSTASIRKALFESNILVGSSSNPDVIRLFPPLTTSADEIALFEEALTAAVSSPATA